MNKKSILFLTNAYPDFDTSYRGIFIRKMATLLEDDGYEIAVVTPKIYRASRFFEDQKGMRVYRFPFFARDKLLIEYKKIPYLKMALYYVSGIILTFWVMLRYRCRLIHAHWAIPTGVIGILVGAILRRPVIVTIHGSDFRVAMEGPSLLKKIFLCVSKRASFLTCVSEVLRKELEQLGIEGKKIATFPMGVDDNFFEVGRRRKSPSRDRAFTVLSNRNLLRNYNVSLFIRAIPIVLQKEPKVKFLVAGEGPERGNLEKEASDLNLGSSVQFLGRIPNEEMAGLLAEADIFVSTSLYDGTSVSLLEAMACGTFPIVTDIASNREWILDGETGSLFSGGDEILLAKKILEAIRTPELLKKSIAKNRKIAQQGGYWGENIKKMTGIYERVLL